MSARILIIEDNPANLELMSYLLNVYGYTLMIALSAEEGLELIYDELPDLIVCDIQLPGMDGYVFASMIKAEKEFQAIPLVAVTAVAMVGDRDRILAAGFNGYISKPIDPETFVPQIEAFLSAKTRTRDIGLRNPSATPSRAPTNHLTILVVDDRPVNLILKRSIFEPLGYTVITAESMTEALAHLRLNLPDLIISDIEMADGDGFEFLAHLKGDAKLKEIPFIFITSTHCTEEARTRGLALGAARFLFRPIEPEELLREIATCLINQEGG